MKIIRNRGCMTALINKKLWLRLFPGLLVFTVLSGAINIGLTYLVLGVIIS